MCADLPTANSTHLNLAWLSSMQAPSSEPSVRLVAGSSTAIVYDYPGVTRDRLYTRAYWGNTEFVVVDTGGLMGDASKLDAAISAAAMHAISAGKQDVVTMHPTTGTASTPRIPAFTLQYTVFKTKLKLGSSNCKDKPQGEFHVQSQSWKFSHHQRFHLMQRDCRKL